MKIEQIFDPFHAAFEGVEKTKQVAIAARFFERLGSGTAHDDALDSVALCATLGTNPAGDLFAVAREN